MTLPTLTPIKPETPLKPNGHKPPNGNGHHGDGGHSGGGSDPRPEPLPEKKPRSIWPLLLDLGVVTALVGLIFFGGTRSPLIVVGAVLAVVALLGWLRDARAEFRKLSD